MGKISTNSSEANTTLRKIALDLLELEDEIGQSQSLSQEKTQKLIQDLRIHQIELETQGEKLHKTQDSLIHSQEKYHDLFYTAPVGYMICNDKGIIIEVNETVSKILGIEVNDLINTSFARFSTLEHQDTYSLHTKRVLENEGVQSCEMELSLKNGNLVNVSIESIIEKNTEKSISIRSILSDVTKQKRTEKKLHRIKAHYKAAIQTSIDGYWRTNLKGNLLEVNEAYCSMSGYTEEELLTMEIADLEAIETPDDIILHFNKIITGGEDSFQSQHRRKDGSIFDVKIGAQYHQLDDGQLFFFIRDITEYKQERDHLASRTNNLLLNQKILLELAQKNFPNQEMAFNQIIKTDAEQLKLERVSIWLFNQERTEIFCQAIYQRGETRNEKLILKACDYPRYFRALKLNGSISANDAHHNPMTNELSDNYLIPLGITSMMDIPIRYQEEIVGIVCHEHIGSERKWTVEDESFAYSIADMCAMVLMEEARKQAIANLHKHKHQLQTLVSEVTIAEERERRRVALELHDNVIQDLALSKIRLGELAQLFPTDENYSLLNETRNLIERSIKQTRSLVFDLSLPILDLGFEAAIKWLAKETAGRLNIPCQVQDDEQSKPMKREMQVVLYKAVRELLINIGNHAQASEVNISINRTNGNINISVQDDGVGFDQVNIGPLSGEELKFGLFGIRERLNLLNGSVEVSSSHDSGTNITLTAPLEILL